MVYYDGQVITNQVVYGVIGSWLVNLIKKSRWVPFINEHTFWLNRLTAVAIAGISAIGINYSYSYTPDGTFTLALTGLTLLGLWEHAKQWLVSYIFQQIPYHVTKASGDTPTIPPTP